MRTSALVLLGAASLLSAAAMAAGCSAPDPGAVTFGPRANAGEGTTGTSGSGAGPGADSGAGARASDGGAGGSATHDGAAGGGTHDASGGGGSDAAAPIDAAPAANAFTGAGGYASQPVQTSAAQEHMNRGVGTIPTGLNCQGCHNGGGAVRFGIAGTVYTSSAATTGAADTQVRVVKSDGTEYVSVHSDSDGNFWVPDNNGFGAVGGMAGARSASATQLMPQTINAGTCNGCHDGNTQPRLHVP